MSLRQFARLLAAAEADPLIAEPCEPHGDDGGRRGANDDEEGEGSRPGTD